MAIKRTYGYQGESFTSDKLGPLKKKGYETIMGHTGNYELTYKGKVILDSQTWLGLLGKIEKNYYKLMRKH